MSTLRLYKYRIHEPNKINRTKELAEGIMWFSHPDQFNDPFDSLLNYSLAELDLRFLEHITKNLRQLIDSNMLPFALDTLVKDGHVDNKSAMEHLYEGHSTLESLLRKANNGNIPGDMIAVSRIIRFLRDFNLFDMNVFSSAVRALRLDNLHAKFLQSCLHVEREIGILSLSTVIDNPLQWGHYSDGHRGFCIEIEFDQLSFDHMHLSPVQYRSMPPKTVDLWSLDRNGLRLFFQEQITTKHISWAYEEEYRLISSPPTKKSRASMQTLRGFALKVPGRITSVILGMKMPFQSRQQVTEIFQSRGIEVKSSAYTEGSYRVEVQESLFG